MVSIKQIKEQYNIKRQYDLFEPWLKANGFSFSDLPLFCKTKDGDSVCICSFIENDQLVWCVDVVPLKGKSYYICYYPDGSIDEKKK